MRKMMWTSAFCATAAWVTIASAAQPPAPAPNASTTTENRVTVTGCLRAAPAETGTTTTGTTGTPPAVGTTGATTTGGATDAPEAKFVLADATIATPGSTAAAPDTARSSKDDRQTYRLVANPAALTPHVGKKLELTGTLDAAASSTSHEAGAGPVLRVEAGKVLAATCQE